jgi:hypothetical protein
MDGTTKEERTLAALSKKIKHEIRRMGASHPNDRVRRKRLASPMDGTTEEERTLATLSQKIGPEIRGMGAYSEIGDSKSSLIFIRKLTAPLPSTMRWS